MSARDNPDLTVATSPEELLVTSVGSCLLSTFLYFAYRFDLAFGSYSSTSTGTMEQTPQGLRCTGIDALIAVTVSDDETAKRASSLRLKEKMEKLLPRAGVA